MNNKNLSNEIASLKNKIKRLNKENKSLKNNFFNFQEFLTKSYISPRFNAPFSNEEKQAFVFMDYLSEYLRNIPSNNDYHPLVSVIMPTFNRRTSIEYALTSVLTQTYDNFELLIIDDGSTDGTVEFLNTIPDERLKILSHGENKGCSFSRNYGLKNAKGDIIMYLDSDNTWDPRYIEAMVGAFFELPDADALYCGQYLIRNFSSEHPFGVRFCSFNKLLLHNHNFIDLNCFCHKKEIINDIGAFDETLWRLVDWDLILRISNTLKIYSVPVLLSNYYVHKFENRISNMEFDYEAACEILLNRNKIPHKEYNPLDKKVSIILPNHGSLNELKTCLNSVFSCNLGDMADVIVIDINSNTEVVEYLLNLELEGKIKLILNCLNHGLDYTIKKGIIKSDSNSDLLFINTGTTLIKGAIEHMQKSAYDLPDCGLVVPHMMTTNEQDVHDFQIPYAHPELESDSIPSLNHNNVKNLPIFHDGGTLELNFAPLFGTYIKREIYNKIISLNPNLNIHKFFDYTFSDIINYMLNLKIYQIPDAYIYQKYVDMSMFEVSEKELNYIYNNDELKNNPTQKLNHKYPLWDF